MMKFLKFIILTIGVIILLTCICEEVDGIGRFAMILSGTFFIYFGYFFKNEN